MKPDQPHVQVFEGIGVESIRFHRPGGVDTERARGDARVRAAAGRFACDEPGFHGDRHQPPEARERRSGHDAVLRFPRCDQLFPFDQLR